MKNLWKNYNGLFILAAMIAGFFLTTVFVSGAEADSIKSAATGGEKKTISNIKVDKTTTQADLDKATKTEPAKEPKKIENQSSKFLESQFKNAMQRYTQAMQNRLLVEEGLKKAKEEEDRLKGQVDQIQATQRDLQENGFWIINAKDAENPDKEEVKPDGK